MSSIVSEIFKNYGIGEDAQIITINDSVFIATFGSRNFQSRHSIVLFRENIPHMYTIYGYPYDKFIKFSPIYGYDFSYFYIGLKYGYAVISTSFEMTYFPEENLYNVNNILITSKGYYTSTKFISNPENCTFINYADGVITFYNNTKRTNITINITSTKLNSTKYFIYNENSQLVPSTNIDGNINGNIDGKSEAVTVIDLGICGSYHIYDTYTAHIENFTNSVNTMYKCISSVQDKPTIFTVYIGGVTPVFVFSFHKDIIVFHNIGANYTKVMENNELIALASKYIITRSGIYSADFVNKNDMEFDLSGSKYINHCYSAGRYFLKYMKNNKNYYIELGNTKGCFKPLATPPIKLDI